MNTKTKFVAALSALAIAATLAMPSQAEARGRGWAIGAGLIGAGIVAGSIAAAAQPVYVEPAWLQLRLSLPLRRPVRPVGQFRRHREGLPLLSFSSCDRCATPRLPLAPVSTARPGRPRPGRVRFWPTPTN